MSIAKTRVLDGCRGEVSRGRCSSQVATSRRRRSVEEGRDRRCCVKRLSVRSLVRASSGVTLARLLLGYAVRIKRRRNYISPSAMA